MRGRRISLATIVILIALLIASCQRILDMQSSMSPAERLGIEEGIDAFSTDGTSPEVAEESGIVAFSEDLLGEGESEATSDGATSESGTSEQATSGAEEAQDITLTVPSANATGLSEVRISVPELTGESVWAVLQDQNVIPSDVTMNALNYLTIDGEKALELDVSTSFMDYLQNQGTSGERMVLGSIVNSYLDAFDAKSIQITVNGQTLETPHGGDVKGFMRKFPLEG